MTRTVEALIAFMEDTRRAGWHRFLADLQHEDLAHDIHDIYALFESGELFESKVIVSNMPEADLPHVPTQGHSPLSWTHASYKQDFKAKQARKHPQLSPQEVDARAHEMADHSLAKQQRAHSRLTGIVGRMLPSHPPEGHTPNVVGIGSGMGHEQSPGIKHKDLAAKPHTMTGHDFVDRLVDSANHRNKGLGIKNATNHVWSAYDVSDKGHEHPEGSDERGKSQISEIGKLQNMPASKAHPDHEKRTQAGLDTLPSGSHNIGYAKHACGGVTDTGLKKAVQDKYHGFVTNTCCSHRLTGVSHEIIAKHHGIPWKHWQKLVKASGDLPDKGDSEEDQTHDAKRSRKAQLAIDHYRKKYLEDHGYTVHQGWANDTEGKPEPKGGILAAARKGAPLHPKAHDREHVFKGVDLHDHDAELKEALADHAKGDWGHGQSASGLRKAKKREGQQKSPEELAREAEERAKKKAAWEAKLAAMSPEQRAKVTGGGKKKKKKQQPEQPQEESYSLFDRVFSEDTLMEMDPRQSPNTRAAYREYAPSSEPRRAVGSKDAEGRTYLGHLGSTAVQRSRERRARMRAARSREMERPGVAGPGRTYSTASRQERLRGRYNQSGPRTF